MEFVPINLANGEVTTVGTVVYTVPASTAAMVRSIMLVNKTATPVQCYATINFGSGDRHVIPFSLNLGKYSKYDDNSVICLAEGNTIKLWCSVNNAVDFVINGVTSEV